MSVSRRNLLLAGAGAFGGLFIGRGRSHAQISLGDMTVDVVSDGSLTLPGGFIFDPMPQDELHRILASLGQPTDVLTPPCNVTLMRQGNRAVLFDVGSGPDFAPNAGVLLESLAGLGVSPKDITDVVFTHGHPDHLWGLLDDFGDLLFANAAFMIGQDEWDYWTNPATVDSIDASRTAFAVGAQRRLAMIEDQIAFFNDGQEILPGVAAHATFGHTPGHMAFELRQGSESLIILGDSIGNDHIAFARPGWESGSDQDQTLAAQTRLRLMDQLTHDQSQVIGFHLGHGGIGHVDKSGDGFVFVPKETP